MECFFSSLKTERVAGKIYRTREQALADVFDYIERFYNPRRRHSTLRYLSRWSSKRAPDKLRVVSTEQAAAHWVDPVGERHEPWHRKHVGTIERSGYPTRCGIAQRPLGGKLRQKRRPEECANLYQRLSDAEQKNQLLGSATVEDFSHP